LNQLDPSELDPRLRDSRELQDGSGVSNGVSNGERRPFLRGGDSGNSNSNSNNNINNNRPPPGRGDARLHQGPLVTLNPQSFRLDGLTLPENDGEFEDWIVKQKIIVPGREIKHKEDAATQLCVAAFAMDLAALKYLLYDMGVPGDVVVTEDANRNALHCLTMVRLLIAYIVYIVCHHQLAYYFAYYFVIVPKSLIH
jgi:hypothetical protein